MFAIDNIYTISAYLTRPILIRLLYIIADNIEYTYMMRFRRMSGYFAVEFPKRIHFSNIYDFIIFQYIDGYVYYRDIFDMNINDEIYKYYYRFVYKYDKLYYCRRYISQNASNEWDIISEFNYMNNPCVYARISDDTGNFITISMKIGEYIEIYNVWKIEDDMIYKYGYRISIIYDKSILLSEYNMREFEFSGANDI